VYGGIGFLADMIEFLKRVRIKTYVVTVMIKYTVLKRETRKNQKKTKKDNDYNKEPLPKNSD
jgi:hypothetical protein